MYKIRFMEQADLDLVSIYSYSYRSWGEPQAIKYTELSRAAINKIAINPERIGTVNRSYVRLGYRSYRQKRHLIFHRVVDSYVEIVRFLHDSMDIESHFSDKD